MFRSIKRPFYWFPSVAFSNAPSSPANSELAAATADRSRSRITSYNVCYTKLLRAESLLGDGTDRRQRSVGDPDPPFFCCFKIDIVVTGTLPGDQLQHFSGINRITSYNVCYTKLLRIAVSRMAASERRSGRFSLNAGFIQLLAVVFAQLVKTASNKRDYELFSELLNRIKRIAAVQTRSPRESGAVESGRSPVITSYSIHYTKLYEWYSMVQC